jgi:hypothetical protein
MEELRSSPNPSSFTPGTDSDGQKSKITTISAQMPLQLPDSRFGAATPGVDMVTQDDLSVLVKGMIQINHFFIGHCSTPSLLCLD